MKIKLILSALMAFTMIGVVPAAADSQQPVVDGDSGVISSSTVAPGAQITVSWDVSDDEGCCDFHRLRMIPDGADVSGGHDPVTIASANRPVLISGDELSGTYSNRLTVPSDAADGDYNLMVQVTDNFGRYSTVVTIGQITVSSSAGDTEVPVVIAESGDLSLNKAVAGDEMTATWEVSDDTALGDFHRIHIVPEGENNLSAIDYFDSVSKVSGNDQYSTHTSTFLIPETAASGIYDISVQVGDQAGKFSAVTVIGQIEVTAFGDTVPDTEAPVVDGDTASISNIELLPGNFVTGTWSVSDDVGCCDFHRLRLLKKGADISGGHDPVSIARTDNITRISGTDVSGTYQGTVRIPSSAEAGTYELMVQVTDFAGKYSTVVTIGEFDVVIPDEDTKAPIVETQNAQIFPSFSKVGEDLRIKFNVSDDVGCCESTTIYLVPDGESVTNSVAEFTGASRIIGDDVVGTYSLLFEIPTDVPVGEYDIRVSATDFAGNKSTATRIGEFSVVEEDLDNTYGSISIASPAQVDPGSNFSFIVTTETNVNDSDIRFDFTGVGTQIGTTPTAPNYNNSFKLDFETESTEKGSFTLVAHEDLDGDGIVDDGEKVSQATVSIGNLVRGRVVDGSGNAVTDREVRLSNNSGVSVNTVVDDMGRYSFYGVDGGSYTLNVFPLNQMFDASQDYFWLSTQVFVSQGTTERELAVTSLPTGSNSLLVELSPSSVSPNWVSLFCLPSSGGNGYHLYQNQKNNSDQYEFLNLANTNCTIGVGEQGYMYYEDTVSVSQANQVEQVTMTPTGTNSISGTVTNSSSQPIADVLVQAVYESAGSRHHDSAWTASDGSYQLDGYPDGAVKFLVYAPGDSGYTSLPEETVNVSGNTTKNVQLAVQASGNSSVSATVVDYDGAPVSGLKVRMERQSSGGSYISVGDATTSASGVASFSSLPAGTYRFQTETQAGYTWDIERVSLGDNESRSLNFEINELSPHSIIGNFGDVTIASLDEAGIPGVIVRLTYNDGTSVHYDTVTTDANGRYEFVNAPYGSSQIRFDVSQTAKKYKRTLFEYSTKTIVDGDAGGESVWSATSPVENGPRTIAGTLVDENSNAVQGATVVLTDSRNSYDYQTTTDASGAFQFNQLEEDVFTLRFTDPDFYTKEKIFDVKSSDKTFQTVEIFSRSDIRISGTVVDQDGNPVAGAPVEAYATGSSISWRTQVTSDENGFYELRGAPYAALGGQIKIYVGEGLDGTLPYFPTEEISINAPASDITRVIILRAYETGTGSLGLTFIDSNGDPVTNADAYMFKREEELSEQQFYSSSTNSAGQVSFSNLPDGEFQMYVFSKEFLLRDTTFIIEDGEAVTQSLRLVAEGTETVTGVVRDSVTNQPVSDVLVRFTFDSFDSFWSRNTVTASDGSYSIDNVPRGSISVSIEPSARESEFQKTESDLNFTGQSTADLTIDPISVGGAIINGTVTDEDGPVQGATVRASYRLDGNYTSKTATTAADGTYTFVGLPEDSGVYLSIASNDHYRDFGQEVFPTTDGVDGDFTLTSKSSITFSGRILEETDGTTPVANIGVSLSLSDADFSYFANSTTNAQGEFSFADVPSAAVSGELVLRYYPSTDLSGEYFSSPSLQLDKPTADTSQDFAIRSATQGIGQVSGTVTDRDTGDALGGMLVSINTYYQGSEDLNFSFYNQITSASDGTYSFSNLQTGDDFRHSLNFYAPNYEDYLSESFTVSLSEEFPTRVKDAQLRAKPKGNSVVSGFVLDQDGNPIAGANVNANSVDSQFNLGYSTSDQNGFFEITGLPSGSIRLNAYSNDQVDGRNKYKDSWSNFTLVDFANSSSSESVNLELEEYETGSSTISGRLIDETTGDPVVGAEVYLSGDWQDFYGAIATTDNNGEWSFTNLAPMDYRISYFLNEGEWQFGEQIHFAEIATDGINRQLSDHTIRSLPTSAFDKTVSVTVRDRDSLEPIPNAEVYMYLENSTISQLQIETNSSGIATFEKLPAGSYSLYINKQGYTSPLTLDRKFEIGEGENLFTVGLENLNAQGFLSGQVTSFANPIADAWVNVMYQPGGYSDDSLNSDQEGFYESTRTDGNGNFQLDGLPMDRELKIEVNANLGGNITNLAPMTKFLTIDSATGEITGESFALQPEAKIVGRLQTDDGLRLADLSINVVDATTGDYAGWGRVDATGAFTISSLAAGDYRIFITDYSDRDTQLASGFVVLTSAKTGVLRGALQGTDVDNSKINVGVGSIRDIGVIDVELGGSISGELALQTVNGPALTYQRAIGVRVYKEVGSSYEILDQPRWFYAYGWDGGKFTLNGLEPGNYKIQFVDGWGSTNKVESVFYGGAETIDQASVISVTAGAKTVVDSTTVAIPEPSSNPYRVNLSDLTEFEVTAKQDKVRASTSGRTVVLDVGDDLAGEWVSVTQDSNLQLQTRSLRTLSTDSSWQQVDEDGKVSVSAAQGSNRVAVTNSDNVLVGWTTFTATEDDSTPDTGGGGSAGGGAPAGGGGGGGAAGSAPVATSSPTIAGSHELGSTVGAGIGEWDSEEYEFSYQWYRCDDQLESPTQLQVLIDCDLIQGATAETYEVSEADSDKHLLASISASAGFYSTTAFSNTIAPGETIEGDFSSEESVETPSAAATETGFWTKRNGDNVKIYAKNIIGLGKVQFYVNGEEIAWIRAADLGDPKLRVITEGPMTGASYLVRDKDLRPGKNVFEIYVDGERVERRVASLS